MNIGQLIITGISGLQLTEEESSFIEKENIGGVILFSRNYESPAQLAELINSIQGLREEYPLFLSTDHEGGRVQRLKKGFTIFPSMNDIGKLDSPKICYHLHKIMAEELSTAGVNLNFSPCCDILKNSNNKVIGDRSFGSDALQVEKFISSAIRGLKTNGILSCAKHFPGHGTTQKDSHLELPYLNSSLKELESNELIPFVKAVKSRVDFIMMAHIVVDAFNKKKPVSIAKESYKYLREKLKYSKLIVTDDMGMKAITSNYGVGEASVMALNAGADIVMYGEFKDTVEGVESINEAVKKKIILNENIEKKLKRVKKCKQEYFVDYRPIYIPGIGKKILKSTSQVFLDEITQKISLDKAE